MAQTMTVDGLTDYLAKPSQVSVVGPDSSPSSADGGFSFSDLFDIVNPLQHIPIVSTVYRAITGDHIKTFPKIAGDALFGGVVGFFSSIADTIFERITGKSFGDTALAWIKSELSQGGSAEAATTSADPAARVATVSPRSLSPRSGFTSGTPTVIDTMLLPGQNALLIAMTRNEIDQDLAIRADIAYRNTLSVSGHAAASALR